MSFVRVPAYRQTVPFSRTHFSHRDRSVARPAPRIDPADPSLTGRGDSPWTLAVLAFALCVITIVSLFANGNAAIALLGLGLATAVVGVPAFLVVGHLRGNPTDRYPTRAT